MTNYLVKKICCIGAGYVGWPTMAVIANKCADIEINVVDASGKKVMEKNYSKKIKDSHYSDSRTKNKDAYSELFEEVARNNDT